MNKRDENKAIRTELAEIIKENMLLKELLDCTIKERDYLIESRNQLREKMAHTVNIKGKN